MWDILNVCVKLYILKRYLLFIFRIDLYYGDIHAELNLAATINHSRQNANLKPYVDDTSSPARVFFVALHIPQSVEFLWNYGDADLEYHANSQTLPPLLLPFRFLLYSFPFFFLIITIVKFSNLIGYQLC